jgi:hypothetical protein
VHKTKAKYPQANIIDYLHIGRDKGADTSLEKFKLWLKQNNKEFGVFVKWLFANQDDEIKGSCCCYSCNLTTLCTNAYRIVSDYSWIVYRIYFRTDPRRFVL